MCQRTRSQGGGFLTGAAGGSVSAPFRDPGRLRLAGPPLRVCPGGAVRAGHWPTREGPGITRPERAPSPPATTGPCG